MSDRITLRIGDLAGPLSRWCERHGQTPSEATRTALARMLRVEAPAMEGRQEHIAKVNAAKRAKRKGRK
ncbi:MAG: hypothetical protein EBR82_68635 [Caulobacteraceae bacterium]|nr:hypothetical protein [Caulobacteraceae bacterium]